MQFFNKAHMRLCLLLIPAALCLSSCDDGPMETCCAYFEQSNAYISANADPDQGPRELFYIYPDVVREFAKKNDNKNAAGGAGEYLCTLMPEMKGINYQYSTNDDKDAQSTCAESIPKHSEMANKVKEAWDNCCFVLGSHVLILKENACKKIDSKSDPESSAKCRDELKAKQFEYLSCFRTYITQDTCEYIIN